MKHILKKYKIDGVIYANTIDVLKEMSKSHSTKELKEILENDYTEIYLMFDLELQDPLYNVKEKNKILNEMLDLFNNETENGLLFINYPMIEAYRHWKNKDKIIEEFKDSIVLCSKAKSYKNDLNKLGSIYDVNRYTMKMFKDITVANVMKTNLLINNSYQIPEYNDFVEFVDGKRILNNQFSSIDNGSIFALCPAMFLFLSYYGEKLYTKFSGNNFYLMIYAGFTIKTGVFSKV